MGHRASSGKDVFDLPDRIHYQGIPFSGKLFPRNILERVQCEFNTRDDDVILLGFPKSGTTWLQMITWLLMNKKYIDMTGPHHEIAGNTCSSTSSNNSSNSNSSSASSRTVTTTISNTSSTASNSSSSSSNFHNVSSSTSALSCTSNIWDLVPTLEMSPPGQPACIDVLENMAGPRLYKCHLPCSVIANRISSSKCKCVVMIRNPKDVQASYYHFTKLRYPKLDLTWDAWFKGYVQNRNSFGSWFDHVNGWWQQGKLETDKYFFVFYEDLKIDPLNTIADINDFLGTRCTMSDVIDITSRTSFVNMKTDPVACLNSMNFMKQDGEHIFYRKGQVGDWQSLFTEKQAMFVDDKLEEALDTELIQRYYQK